MRNACLVAAAGLLAACPIAPNNYGNDGGGSDAGITDGGSIVDAGTPASGTISAQVTASDPSVPSASMPTSWSGTDLAGTTASFDGTSYTVDVIAANATSGTLKIGISNLVPGGATAPQLTLLGWEAPAGFAVPDTWTCSTGSCNPNVSVTAFDGTTLTGSFFPLFFAQASSSRASEASFNGGAFTVVLPH